MNDSGVRIRVSREDFARAFSLHRRAEGRPVVERVSLSEGNPIELYSLFAEVMCVEGFLVVSRRRLWSVIAAKLGFTQSLETQEKHTTSSPLASQLEGVYDIYLLDFECQIVDAAARNIVANWSTGLVPNFPVTLYPPGDNTGWEVDDFLKLLPFTKQELLFHHILPDVINTLEEYRPVFWHLLRNLQAFHRRNTVMARLAESTATHTMQLAAPDITSSPRESTSRADPVTCEGAEQEPLDPHEPDNSATRFSSGNSVPLMPDAGPWTSHGSDHRPPSEALIWQEPSTPSNYDSSREQPWLPPIPYLRVRKPFVGPVQARTPTLVEVREATIWLDYVRQALLRGGAFHHRPVLQESSHRDPPRSVSDADWPVFYALFVEVFQEMSRLCARLPMIVCALSEADAFSAVHDMLLVFDQKRFLNEGVRYGLFSIQRLRTICDTIRGWKVLLPWLFTSESTAVWK